MGTKTTLLLDDLNDDVLLIIFGKCSIEDILSLYYVCKHFQNIIGGETLRRLSLDLLIVGHRNKNAIAFQRLVKCLSIRSYYIEIK